MVRISGIVMLSERECWWDFAPTDIHLFGNFLYYIVFVPLSLLQWCSAKLQQQPRVWKHLFHIVEGFYDKFLTLSGARATPFLLVSETPQKMHSGPGSACEECKWEIDCWQNDINHRQKYNKIIGTDMKSLFLTFNSLTFLLWGVKQPIGSPLGRAER